MVFLSFPAALMSLSAILLSKAEVVASRTHNTSVSGWLRYLETSSVVGYLQFCGVRLYARQIHHLKCWHVSLQITPGLNSMKAGGTLHIKQQAFICDRKPLLVQKNL